MQRVDGQARAGHLGLGHGDGGDGAVFVGLVIIDAAGRIDAAAVKGVFGAAVGGIGHAAGDGHGVQQVEELRHRVGLGLLAAGVQAMEGRADEAGGRRGVAGQADGAHAQAVGVQRRLGGEAVGRVAGRQVEVGIEVDAVIGKRRIVGQHAHVVFRHAEAVLHLFEHQTFPVVAEHPVQRGHRQVGGGRDVGDAQAGQIVPQFGDRGVPAEEPGDQLMGGEVEMGGIGREVPGRAGKVQSRHGQAALIGGLGIEGAIVAGGGHPDHCIAGGQDLAAAEQQVMVPGRDDNLVAEPLFQVEISAEIVVAGRQFDAGAHGSPSFSTSLARTAGRQSPQGAANLVQPRNFIARAGRELHPGGCSAVTGAPRGLRTGRRRSRGAFTSGRSVPRRASRRTGTVSESGRRDDGGCRAGEAEISRAEAQGDLPHRVGAGRLPAHCGAAPRMPVPVLRPL